MYCVNIPVCGLWLLRSLSSHCLDKVVLTMYKKKGQINSNSFLYFFFSVVGPLLVLSDKGASTSDGSCSSSSSCWLRELNLSKREKHILSSSKPLNANLINAAQGILSSQFPEVEGFQDTALSQNIFRLCPVPPNKKSVQIMHTGMILATLQVEYTYV